MVPRRTDRGPGASPPARVADLLHALILGADRLVGSTVEVADHMEAWGDSGAVDGLNLQPASLPDQLDAFADLLPEPRGRGRFRTEHLGFVVASSLSHEPPWGLARRCAALD